MTHASDPAARYRETLRDLAQGGLAAGAVGLFVNILHLSLPLFTIQVYDRVLSSGSTETLAALAILAVTLLSFQTLLEVMRQRIFVILANRAMGRLGAPRVRSRRRNQPDAGPAIGQHRLAGRV